MNAKNEVRRREGSHKAEYLTKNYIPLKQLQSDLNTEETKRMADKKRGEDESRVGEGPLEISKNRHNDLEIIIGCVTCVKVCTSQVKRKYGVILYMQKQHKIMERYVYVR